VAGGAVALGAASTPADEHVPGAGVAIILYVALAAASVRAEERFGLVKLKDKAPTNGKRGRRLETDFYTTKRNNCNPCE
jgi:hypothetical protein